MDIRQLNPGSAWKEAERRAIPFGFAGFFVAGVICVFGHDLGLREPLLAGICGAVGLFLAEIAFATSFYRRQVALAIIATPLILVLPTVVTSVLLPWIGNGKTAFIPGIVVGLGLYVLLHGVHKAYSGLPLATYVHQIANDQDTTPTKRWQRNLVWLLASLGTIVILGLLMR